LLEVGQHSLVFDCDRTHLLTLRCQFL
jgi:hypothetical protein